MDKKYFIHEENTSNGVWYEIWENSDRIVATAYDRDTAETIVNAMNNSIKKEDK